MCPDRHNAVRQEADHGGGRDLERPVRRGEHEERGDAELDERVHLSPHLTYPPARPLSAIELASFHCSIQHARNGGAVETNGCVVHEVIRTRGTLHFGCVMFCA